MKQIKSPLIQSILPPDIGAAKIGKRWVAEGQIDLDFSQAMPTSFFRKAYQTKVKYLTQPAKAKLTVSYPKFQSKGQFTASITFTSESKI